MHQRVDRELGRSARAARPDMDDAGGEGIEYWTGAGQQALVPAHHDRETALLDGRHTARDRGVEKPRPGGVDRPPDAFYGSRVDGAGIQGEPGAGDARSHSIAAEVDLLDCGVVGEAGEGH